jgi:hypothetical protein
MGQFMRFASVIFHSRLPSVSAGWLMILRLFGTPDTLSGQVPQAAGVTNSIRNHYRFVHVLDLKLEAVVFLSKLGFGAQSRHMLGPVLE